MDTPKNPPPVNASWPIAVFAHNEEGHIVECLESLYRAAAGKPFRCFVLVNGCTDGTARCVSAYATHHPEVTLVPIALGDKSNAWNVYIHEFAPPDSEIHFFVDGDINVMPHAFVDLSDALKASPAANAAAAFPVSGRNKEKIRRGVIEQRDLLGNLYALNGHFVKRLQSEGIRLPIGLIGDDSIVGALAKWNLDPRGPWERERIVFAEGAGFSFVSLSWRRLDNWRLYWRRRIRYSLRGYQNQLLRPVLKKEGVTAMPRHIDELYKQYAHQCRLRWRELNPVFDGIALRQIRRVAEPATPQGVTRAAPAEVFFDPAMDAKNVETTQRIPLVSVIVPVHNGARYIGAALKSALAQDYRPKEIIVVDDGSTDDTPNVLRGFGESIRVIRQTNAGAAAARNTALEAARGDYLAFLDADDLWLPGKLTAQVQYLESHRDIGMVYSAWQEWQANAAGEFETLPPPDAVPMQDIDPALSGWLYNALLLECVIHTTTAVMRRAVVKQVGLFDTQLRRGQDYDYWLRVSRVTPIHKLKPVLSLYRIHRESVTRKPQATNYGYLVIKSALERWGYTGPDGRVTPKREVDRVLAGLWYGYGYTHYARGDAKLAVDAFWHCIGYRPFWYSGWGYWLRSLLKSRRAPGVSNIP